MNILRTVLVVWFPLLSWQSCADKENRMVITYGAQVNLQILTSEMLDKASARNFIAPSTLSSQRPRPYHLFLSKSTLASFAAFARDTVLFGVPFVPKFQIYLVRI